MCSKYPHSMQTEVDIWSEPHGNAWNRLKHRSLPKKTWWNYQLCFHVYIIIELNHFKDLSIESQTDGWVREGFEAWMNKCAGTLRIFCTCHLFSLGDEGEWAILLRKETVFLHLSSICCGGSFLRLHSDILRSFLLMWIETAGFTCYTKLVVAGPLGQHLLQNDGVDRECPYHPGDVFSWCHARYARSVGWVSRNHPLLLASTCYDLKRCTSSLPPLVIATASSSDGRQRVPEIIRQPEVSRLILAMTIISIKW